MGGKSSSKTESSQQVSNSFSPWVTTAGQGLFNTALKVAEGQPYQGYSGPTQAAFGEGTGIATDYLKGQLGTVDSNTQKSGQTFQSIIDSIDPNASVSSYMNPYTDAVLAPTIRNINESADTARAGAGTAASMAGAWGGSGQGVASALADRNRLTQISDATGAAYGKAFDTATAAKGKSMSDLLAAAQGAGTTGQNAFGQGTQLATLLAGLGGQQQAAGQTGINTAIGVNESNQMGATKQMTSLAQILAMIPKNTSGMQTGSSTTTQPDNSMIALLGSLL